MTAQPKDDGHFRFEVQVGGEYRDFDFDTDAARITGSEALLIDQVVRDYMGAALPLPPAGEPGSIEDPRVAVPVVRNSTTTIRREPRP